MPRIQITLERLTPSARAFVNLFNRTRKIDESYSGITTEEKAIIHTYNQATATNRITKTQLAQMYEMPREDVNTIFRRNRADLHRFMSNEDNRYRLRDLINKDEFNPTAFANHMNIARHQFHDYLRYNPVNSTG